ncbi:spore germination protein [Peribacillus sp. NPDC097295]|uniref:spore germination protein n=1 Tax=Peribacillus sp. NPDC097295 TaxID=3364402 RepID=UPI0038107F78
MNQTEQEALKQDLPLFKELSKNRSYLKATYENCDDVTFHTFFIGGHTEAVLLYMEGLSDTKQIENNVMETLMDDQSSFTNIHKTVKEKLHVLDAKEIHTFTDCITYVSIGYSILMLQREDCALALGLVKTKKRPIEEPEAESVVRGPREGFIEDIKTNISLIRKKISSPTLKMQSFKVGSYTKTEVVLAYIEGKADKQVLEKLKTRINQMELDGVLETGYIEGFIKDHPYSPFPQLLTTERPDVAAANLLEGRIVILVDGTPFILVAPVSFYSFIQSPEDYYFGFLIGSSVRLLRYLFIFFSVTLPSIYVAILTFHQEMIPTTLLITIASSREAIPFPAFVEAIMMEVTFEALREAGLRLPKQIGAAVSIVGGLVIGQAAVQAGIVSAPMVIVVSLTGIASFLVPRYSQGIALRLLRFPVILLAGTLGLFGLMLGIMTIGIHLCKLTSIGVPYLPPMRNGAWKDIFVRASWQSLQKRSLHDSNQKNLGMRGKDSKA